SMILRKNTTNFSRGTVPIIGSGLHNYRHASRRVTLVSDFIKVLRFRAFTPAPLDRTIDIVIGHAGRARRQYRAPQSGITILVPSGSFRRDRDFLRKLAENLAAFGVNGAFEAFYL